MPARRASGFSGAQIQPPDQAVVPPNTGSFSATMTFRPCQAAVTAADNPPEPEPITSRSQVSSVHGDSAITSSCGPGGHAGIGLPEGVLYRQVGERNGRPDGDSGSGIDSAHDRVRLVAAGIESTDRLAARVHNSCSIFYYKASCRGAVP